MLMIVELEALYDTFAQALDAVAPEQRELFLVKLVLLQAEYRELPFAELVQRARQDL